MVPQCDCHASDLHLMLHYDHCDSE
jgi:hypothetical protein